MSEELDLDEANQVRKAVYHLVLRGQRREAVERASEHLRLVQEAPEASPVVCKAGCAYCCSLPVMITPSEAEVIAELIRNSSRHQELLERIESSFAKIKRRSFEELCSLREPCPLLDGEEGQGLCAVYPVRPIACRAFTSDDLDACLAVYRDAGAEVTSPARQLDYMTQLLLSSGLAGPLQKAFELRGALLELLTGKKNRRAPPTSMSVRFGPK